MRANDPTLHGRVRRGRRISRRRWVLVALGLTAPFIASRGLAESVTAPVVLQAELLAKVAEYDRNFAARAGDRAIVLLVTQPGNADSVTIAQQMSAALGRLSQIAGLPHEESIVPYPGAAELARICRDRHVAIVYFAPGFRDDVADLRKALSTVDTLSVASVPDYVRDGIVLGFDVVSGRPKLLLNLPQARLQKVALAASVLKLMTVFE